MKRIAWLFPSFGAGGVQRTIIRLTGGFLERGIAVDLLVIDAAGPFEPDIPAGARVVNLRAPGVLAAIPALWRYLRATAPHALISAQNHVNLAAVVAHRLSGAATRLILTERNDMLMGLQQATSLFDRLRAPASRLLYPLADELVAVSQGVAESVQRITGLSPDRIHTIYHPSVPGNLEELTAELPDHEWFAARSAPVVLAVGRLTAQKDYPTLLHAMQIMNRISPTRLIILGEGPLRPSLEGLAHQLGISANVAMPGFRANPYAYMNRADVFVLSSIFEGFPNVLVEALACGANVVATDCRSGPGEILDRGRFGRLVAVGNATALAQAIREALQDTAFDPQTAIQRSALFSVEGAIRGYLPLLFPAGQA